MTIMLRVQFFYLPVVEEVPILDLQQPIPFQVRRLQTHGTGSHSVPPFLLSPAIHRENPHR